MIAALFLKHKEALESKFQIEDGVFEAAQKDVLTQQGEPSEGEQVEQEEEREQGGSSKPSTHLETFFDLRTDWEAVAAGMLVYAGVDRVEMAKILVENGIDCYWQHFEAFTPLLFRTPVSVKEDYDGVKISSLCTLGMNHPQRDTLMDIVLDGHSAFSKVLKEYIGNMDTDHPLDSFGDMTLQRMVVLINEDDRLVSDPDLEFALSGFLNFPKLSRPSEVVDISNKQPSVPMGTAFLLKGVPVVDKQQLLLHSNIGVVCIRPEEVGKLRALIANYNSCMPKDKSVHLMEEDGDVEYLSLRAFGQKLMNDMLLEGAQGE